MLHLPFDKDVYGKSFWIACFLAIVGWVLIYMIWGEYTPSDIIGMIVTVPILAYLIQVLLLMTKK